MTLIENRIETLKQSLTSVRARLTTHQLYTRIRRPEDFRRFMHYHVYAVWDFMSLLKSLQRGLTCVETPWVPRGSANTRYLINEIVLGEESDVDEAGNRISHFELYLRAMEQAGADTAPIGTLITAIGSGMPVEKAIMRHVKEGPVRDFLWFTFDIIASGKLHVIAAVFTFGREDLIPDLFLPIVRNFSEEGGSSLNIFKYYLERHIEVDGGHHSHLAVAMLEELCGEDPVKWEEATDAARVALEVRIGLWEEVLQTL